MTASDLPDPTVEPAPDGQRGDGQRDHEQRDNGQDGDGQRGKGQGSDEWRGDEERLAAATQSLREHVDPRWVEVSDRVLARALTATRRSLPIRTSEDMGAGALLVSEQVLISSIRHAIAPVPAAAPSRIHIHSDTEHNYTGVTIEITVQFDEPILPIADEIRDRTDQVLRELLGPIHPPVTVRGMHVHVSDVTGEDPHTGRPGRGGA